MNILEVNALTKHYGQHCAIDNISFTISKEMIIGLLGPNGAGKTTLIRALTKIIEPDNGIISFQNKEVTLKTAAKFGYLPEERGLYKKMNVIEHLLFLARLKGLKKRDAIEKINHWLEKFSIQDWRQKKIEDLSKGMQQKVQFIATVLHDPELLILDEPFSGFDPVNSEIITEEILQLKEKGVTIIFSTHRMESVEELCEHILFIHNSKLILSESTADIKEKYRNNTFILKHTGILEHDAMNRYDILESKNKGSHNVSTIKLGNNIAIKDLLPSLWNNQEIIGFEEKTPSIKEIFIKNVTSS